MFIWPAWSNISSYFGPDHPLGIDMGLAYFPSSPIVAAADGVVTFAGGRGCCGYGYHVIISHKDGFVTLYAHLEYVETDDGQHVRQGDFLGISGDTGLSTSEHLHFEIRQWDTHLDPLLYLPREDPPG